MALRTSSMVVVVAASLTLVACSSNGEETTTVDTTPSTTVAPITTEASTTTVESTVAPTSGVTTVPPERPYSLWEEVAPPVLPVGHTTPFVESGELLDGKTPIDVLRATLPAGTVSGAPKIRAMQIIAQIEDCYRRGQPILVGTVSIEKSEQLSELLKAHTFELDGKTIRGIHYYKLLQPGGRIAP